jgi:hypothetical protein
LVWFVGKGESKYHEEDVWINIKNK